MPGKIPLGLSAVVPFGTLIASVLLPKSKLTSGESVPIPTLPSKLKENASALLEGPIKKVPPAFLYILCDKLAELVKDIPSLEVSPFCLTTNVPPVV